MDNAEYRIFNLEIKYGLITRLFSQIEISNIIQFLSGKKRTGTTTKKSGHRDKIVWWWFVIN